MGTVSENKKSNEKVINEKIFLALTEKAHENVIEKERKRRGNKPKWTFKERNYADTYLDFLKCY